MTEKRWNISAKLDATERQAWFAVRTNPRCERRAVTGLTERGFSAYLPVETRWRRNGKERKPTENPLMVGYLFAALDEGQSIYDLRRVDGVASVVGVNGRPVQVDPWAVLHIAASESLGAFDKTGTRHRKFEPGQKVTITVGPFKGHQAKVEELLDAGKVRLMLEGKFIKGELTFDDDEVEVPKAA